MAYEKDKSGLASLKVDEFESGRAITDIFSKPNVEDHIIGGETLTFQPFLSLQDAGKRDTHALLFLHFLKIFFSPRTGDVFNTTIPHSIYRFEQNQIAWSY